MDEKSRIGDWEIDTVIGKGHSGALVTIVERATKFPLVANEPNKSAEAVSVATIKLLSPTGELYIPSLRITARSSPITSNSPQSWVPSFTLLAPIIRGREV